MTSNAGRTITFSAMGFGAAPLGNMHRPLPEAEADATVRAAWDEGLRYFDTAPLYGHGLSEMRLGRTLRSLPRESFVVSTKVGRILEPCRAGEEDSGIYVATPQLRVRFDYTYDGIMRSLESSLGRLGLDRVDILYLHDIEAKCHGRAGYEARFGELFDQGGWKALDELRKTGAVTAIGAGVNEVEPCARLLEQADPDIFLLAGRFTLLDQSAQGLLADCQGRGVGVVAGGPFNSGILATGPVDGARYDYAAASEGIRQRTQVIADICVRNGVSLPHAALHFALMHPAILSVIPGGQTPDEVRHNAELFRRPVPSSLWTDLVSAGALSPGAIVAAPSSAASHLASTGQKINANR
ncbi:aldo/keto reductase [Novosphingobium flavum]|uniref:Aldo/keto reductase n=2 Tax=Novosphingobium flavum TaxID=1778672 RepID=A0A7X1KMU3_9SPHN|nr:aldo/keto reductase [Novosphingobium flavum]